MTLLERAPLLAKLDGFLNEARRGRGRLVLVAGEAGVGKSSLVEAFVTNHARVRTLRGSCDPVTPPRPFGPLLDMVPSGIEGNRSHDGRGDLETRVRDALDEGIRDRVFEAVVDLIRRPPTVPFVMVLEDVHWADEATLDLLRVLGRRVDRSSVLVVATYRDDEVGGGAPLRLALGDVPPAAIGRIQVPPLTLAAVAELSAGSPADPRELHQVTAGNAFFVTEVLANAGGHLPATVRDAVLARIGRLPAEGARVAEAASVLGLTCEPALLLAVAADDGAGLEACLDSRILSSEDEVVAFRHELARRAVLDSVPAARQTALHRSALACLQAGVVAADPGRLAIHAVGAGDAAAALAFAPAAGRWAADLGAHREAVVHYAAALRWADRLDDAGRAELLSAYARECLLIDDAPRARQAQEQALAGWRRVGDRLREADGLRQLSGTLYFVGDTEGATRTAEEAVAVLESLDGGGSALALAVATVAQRRMQQGLDDEAALAWGRRALALATAAGSEEAAVHALASIGVGEIYLRVEDGWRTLEESRARATAAGLHADVARALVNLVESGLDSYRHDIAIRNLDEGLQFADDHGLVLLHRLLRERQAELDLRLGHWDAAERECRALLAQPDTANQVRVRSLTVLGRLAARRASEDPWPLLDQALTLTGPSQLQELCPLRSARAEAAWLSGDFDRAGSEAKLGLVLARLASEAPMQWWWGELAFWAWRHDRLNRLASDAPEAYLLHSGGRHGESAEVWRRLGCRYEAAVALADSDNIDWLREALSIFNDLGAIPMARRVGDLLRGRGERRIPRGPRASTLGNPARLTNREVEVLELVADGLTNAGIAERLVLSPRTVEHHVSSMFQKLEVTDREAAAREAVRFGIRLDSQVGDDDRRN